MTKLRGSKILLLASIVLTFYGGVNLVYCLILWLGASSVDNSMLDLNRYGMAFWTYLVIQGAIPFVIGGLGLFWHNQRFKIKYVYIMSWILLVVEFGIFFSSYGASVFTVVFDLGCVIVALVYWYGSDQNYQEEKEYQLEAKKRKAKN